VRKETDVKALTAEAEKSVKKGKIHPIILDVTSQSQIDAAHAKIVEFTKTKNLPIVAVVNNAGIDSYSPFETIEIPVLRQLMETNFVGAVALTQKFIPNLRHDQGRIIFIGSLNGIIATYGTTSYSATKYAMEAAADALRPEMQDFGVSVSIVQPGYIESNMTKQIPKPTGTPEQQKLYKKFWDYIQKLPTCGSVQLTTDVITHAVTDKYPQARYPVGPANGFDARLVAILDAFLPDRLSDILKADF